MVYINSRGEVVDETKATPTNIFWRLITFIVLFFKTLIGIEDRSNKKNDDKGRGPTPGGSGGFFGGGGSGKGDNSNKGPRKFGPKGFKSITDLTPPPAPPMMGGCSGGSCG